MLTMNNPAITPQRPSSWSQEQRLEFIDFRLYWEERINRSDIMSFFGVSIPQASLDLARYQELAPHNIQYNKKLKAYFATPDFKPVLILPNAYHYLNQLLGINTGMLRKETAFPSWYPATDVVSHPHREVPSTTLREVLKAIRHQRMLEITYQSLRSPTPIVRHISPHAIAFDGCRWHVRAYCHLRQAFRDFLFARMLHLQDHAPSPINAASDTPWHTLLDIKIAPHPALSETQRQVIELDYNMQNGFVTLQTRQALLRYVLKSLGLWKELLDGSEGKLMPWDDHIESVSEHPVIVVNQEALIPYLEPVR